MLTLTGKPTSMSSNKPPSKRLFIGSLPYNFTEGELLSLFVPFGRITAIRIMHNQWGKSRGLGFVEFDDLNSAINAKTKLHNYSLGERTIIVDYAEPDPFLTPEGQARHEEAQARKPKPRIKSMLPLSPQHKPLNIKKKFTSRSEFEHLRQSVYDSRNYHASVGAKFAHRTLKKR
jgi:RNA recognition motif-containing protein